MVAGYQLLFSLVLFGPIPVVSFTFPQQQLQQQQSYPLGFPPPPSVRAAIRTSLRATAITTPSSPSSESGATRQKRVSRLQEWSKQDSVKIQMAPGAITLQESAPNAGLGLVTTAQSPIQSGSVVVTVPATIALSVELPRGGPDDTDVDRMLIQDRSIFRTLPWYAQFALYLYKLDMVSSTKQNIDFRPWLDSLPRRFGTPIHWTADQRAEWLQYPHMVEAVDRQESSWRGTYEKLRSCTTPSANKMTWDDFVWGCECARSRAFSGGFSGSPFNPFTYIFTLFLVTAYVGLDLGTLEQAANGAAIVVCVSILRDFVLPKVVRTKKYVICPIIDMCNHRSQIGRTTATVAYEFFANAYSLATTSVVPANTEIYISYGARSNDQLLQYYGFVEVDNPHDTYVMPPLREWDIAALEKALGGTPFPPGRLQKLDRAGLLGKSIADVQKTAAVAAASGDGGGVDDDDTVEGTTSEGNPRGGVVLSRAVGIDPAVIQALRALVSTDQEWDDAGESIGNFAAQVSFDNECRARLAARTAIESELATKATTLAEDRTLLKQFDATNKRLGGIQEPGERLALEFRIEKKKLLRETIDRLL
jgi:hypothetical protein